MNYSQKMSDRHWNISDKADNEYNRENVFIDDIIQKSHIEKEILSDLSGIRTVFDGGAGVGRFTIMLAKLGLSVTHFDISEVMLDKAKELAKQADVFEKMTFVKGALEDLTNYTDGEFDMVMSFDAPVSYTYPNHEDVISELIRIANKRIIISVSSRLGTIPYFSNPLQKIQFLLNRSTENKLVKWWIILQKKI